jgi:hypothetical protein
MFFSRSLLPFVASLCYLFLQKSRVDLAMGNTLSQPFEDDDLRFIEITKRLQECDSRLLFYTILQDLTELFANWPQIAAHYCTQEFVDTLARKLEDYALRDLRQSIVVSNIVQLLHVVPTNEQYFIQSSIPFVILCSLRYYFEDDELWTNTCRLIFEFSELIIKYSNDLLPKYITTLISAMIKYPHLSPQVIKFFDRAQIEHAIILDSLQMIIPNIYLDESSIISLFSILSRCTEESMLEKCLLIIQKIISVTQHNSHKNSLYDALIMDWLIRTNLEIKNIVDIIAKEKLHPGILSLFERKDVTESEQRGLRLLALLRRLLKDKRTKKATRTEKQGLMLALGVILNIGTEQIQNEIADLCAILDKYK